MSETIMADITHQVEYTQAHERLSKVQPTLFIALGGTGAEIALRLRRRILTHGRGYALDSVGQFPLAQFILYDLDRGSDDLRKNADHLSDSVAFFKSEKISPSHHYLDPYYYPAQSCRRNPNIDTWLPVSPEWIKEWIDIAEERANFHSPTLQPRFFSRMVFFDEYRYLKDIIQNKLNLLLVGASNKSILDRLCLDPEFGSLRVVVLASTAGATGSGAFIDMGYLAKQLAKRAAMGNTVVDLILLLPGGYPGHDKTRGEANTYAALMELETCMRPGPGFVKVWVPGEYEDLPAKPYDNVYLIDTINLAKRKTARVTDIFDMVADIMFEEFFSSEFSSHKRSVSVNQIQHTIRPLTLPVNAEKFGNMKMNYTKAYSTFGLSVIDIGLEHLRHEIASEHACEMLKAFFGVASNFDNGGTFSPPSSENAKKVLDEHVLNGFNNFKLDYRFVSNEKLFEANIEIPLPNLINQLLYEEGQPILENLHNRINEEIYKILDETLDEECLSKIEKLQKELDRALGINGSQIDASEKEVGQIIQTKKSKDVIFESIVNDNSGFIKALWASVDNKDDGGLDYSIQLIERIKERIENDQNGLLSFLANTQEWFFSVCEILRNKELGMLKRSLLSALSSFWGWKKKERMTVLVKQTGNAMHLYADAHLRMVACREASSLLKELSAWLGEYQGLDECTNRKGWSEDSFAGKLADYGNLVLDIVSGLTAVTGGACGGIESGNPMIQGSSAELEAVRNLYPEMAMEMAKSVFDNLDGARVILGKLGNNQSRAELVGQLHNLALSRLPVLGRGSENTLFKVLEEMDSSERKAIFQNCLESAMPWVEANVEGIWTVNPDQYMCVVGVDGVAIFAQRFGDEFKSSVPTRAGMPATKISFYESGIPGKLTCYVELSGIPLTALNQLPKWRESYEEESQMIPVHIHKDRTLFVHPLVPSATTLDRMADDFKLFIQGVVLGVLKAWVNDPQERVYCLKFPGEELSIGNERLIRLDGLVAQHLDVLQIQVTDALERLNNLFQYSGLVALYDFYTKCVYPPAIVRDKDRRESLQEGFSNVMCRQLGEEAQKVLEVKFPDADFGLIVRLRDTLENWTDEIEGSESDVYEHEVGRPHMAKRRVKPEFFQSGWPKKTAHVDEDSAKLKTCLNCSEETGADSKYCPNCGSKFSDISPPLPFDKVQHVD